MKAAVLKELNNIVIEEVETPHPKNGEILLKVKSCAVCGSDVRIYRHGNPRVKFPQIMGHEIAGEVVEIGEDVDKFEEGDRVAVGADVPCGVCKFCRNGMGNNCLINYAIGYQFQGGFAEYILLNKTTVDFGPVHHIPEGVSFDAAALAEPLACAINGFEVCNVKPGNSICIIGAGPLGCMMIPLARHWGATEVIVAQRSRHRLEIAKKFDADHYIWVQEENLVERVMEITDGFGVQRVFTACASPKVHEDALKIVSQKGWINLFGGLPKNARNISIKSNDIHYKEAVLTGSHGSVPRQHKMALDMIAKGYVDNEELITHYFKLDQVEEAILANENREGLKVMVNP